MLPPNRRCLAGLLAALALAAGAAPALAAAGPAAHPMQTHA